MFVSDVAVFILVTFRSKTHCCVLYIAAVRKFLLFSSQLAVRGIPFNLSSQEDIILPVTGTPSFFVGVDFSAEENSIFFSDTAKDIIFKQKVDGTGKTSEYYLRIDVTSNIFLSGKIVVKYNVQASLSTVTTSATHYSDCCSKAYLKPIFFLLLCPPKIMILMLMIL